ncbi:MAG TPA: hypothetical protein DCG47_06190 [Spirochaetaceae bacterium]|nr:hypothetical protein [Spirochaetaceae bacterium]
MQISAEQRDDDGYGSIGDELGKAAYNRVLSNTFLTECIHDDQYTPLPESAIASIYSQYGRLLDSLGRINPARTEREELLSLVHSHRQSLIAIIEAAAEGESAAHSLPCSEYSAALQVRVLHLESMPLAEPILDLGCGKDCTLVKRLLAMHKDAYGLDQYYSDDPRIARGDWLEYAFLPESWGTVISHMAFSNHFRKAVASGSEDISRYRRSYHKILGSLTRGASFIYSPALRDIEAGLPARGFSVAYYSNIADDPTLDTVRVTRLR